MGAPTLRPPSARTFPSAERDNQAGMRYFLLSVMFLTPQSAEVWSDRR